MRKGLKFSNNIAFLWDESFLWGLMAYKALKSNDMPFELIRSEDIRKGCLKNFKMLFVPGGWASNKLKSLDTAGVNEIRTFVKRGGNYFGICGGAGLATLDGIGLLDIKRKPTKQRVPSFSGKVYLNLSEHPIWNDREHSSIISLKPSVLSHQPIFYVWWPSQFLIEDKNIKILATYEDALPDSFSSDLSVGDVEANGNWSELEDIYKINLNPDRLKNEPAVVEGNFGKGKVILSLIHFDTPDDTNGAKVLKNLWEYLIGQKTDSKVNKVFSYKIQSSDFLHLPSDCLSLIEELGSAVDELIDFGIRNFLWFWRNPILLQWRRGVRGLEYCTLYVMVKEIVRIINNGQRTNKVSEKSEISIDDSIENNLKKIKELLLPFIEKAKQLLILERFAVQNRHITYQRCDDPKIQKIRTELFGNSKSHGGLFKKLIDEVDNLLYLLIKKEQQGKS